MEDNAITSARRMLAALQKAEGYLSYNQQQIANEADEMEERGHPASVVFRRFADEYRADMEEIRAVIAANLPPQ